MKKYNLKLKVATDFVFKFRYKDAENDTVKDLSGFTGSMKIKDKYEGTVIATGIVTIADNIVSVTVPKTQTTALQPGTAVYDISLTNTNNVVMSALYGEIEILPNTLQ